MSSATAAPKPQPRPGIGVPPPLRHITPQTTLYGATISSLDNLTAETAEFSHMSIVRVYYPGLPRPNAWTAEGRAGANHSAVIVSFKALPTTILSGADNAALKQFFDTAPRGYPIYYSYYHEPEDNIAAGQFTLPDYKLAWAHVVALADAAHNPFLHSTLILMAWDLNRYSGRTWTNYLPSGKIISTLGWDAYPNSGVGTPTPASFMGAAVKASKAAKMPFGFAEFGTVTARGRAAWLTAIGQYLQANGALFGSLYDSPINGGLGGSGTFVVSDASSLSAWHAVVRSRH
jgi:hypothetical protein